MKKLNLLSLLVIFILSLVGCTNTKTTEEAGETKESKPQSIILSTTTSTQDSGLLDYLLPKFTEETGIEVKTVAVGTGKAIEMGKNGEADVLLVHDTKSEEEFVKEGFAKERHNVMYNDFVLVGPKDDKLKLKEVSGDEKIKQGLNSIYENKGTFVSRGDDSGTHKKELRLWEAASLKPEGDWYISAGSGMGEVLKMASEKQGYTLSDRATYLAMKDSLDLDIVIEKDTNLNNQYGVMVVNPEKFENLNSEGAKKFEEWILSEETQKLIGEFSKDKYGESLFIPNAK
jgi:tungstate transport system substrate-binding protein